MNRFRLVSCMILVLSNGLAVLELPAADKPSPVRRNVLFIVIDDLRNALGCYGDQQVKSPNIDALAARGMRFDRAYCQYPVCNPSRASLLTGLRPDTTQVLDNTVSFRKHLPEVVTLPQLFRQQGYFTASLGKIFHRGLTMEEVRGEMDDTKSWNVARYFQATPLGNEGEGRNLTGGHLSWCRWLAAAGTDEDQPDGQIAAATVRLLETHRDQPFFLGVGFHKPHDPFIAPKQYFDLYPLTKLKLARDPALRSPDLPLATPLNWKEDFDRFTDQERLELLRAYYAGTSFIDAQVGKILNALDRLGLTDHTVVILLGDHGYHLGEHAWWNKDTIFELCARAPLLVLAPEMKAKGKSCFRLVEFLDLYPTLVELCKLPAPAGLQGKSFVALLDNPKSLWKEAAYTQVQRGHLAGYSVRTERWRYTEWDEGRQGIELYDEEKDPGEYRNLAQEPQYNRTIAELKGLLQRMRKQAQPLGRTGIDRLQGSDVMAKWDTKYK